MVLETSVHWVGCCEETEKDRCFLFLRKPSEKNYADIMYVMEFAVPIQVWLELDPNNQMVTSFWDTTLIILFLIGFFQNALWRENNQIVLSVTMNAIPVWQFEWCQEQKSLAFKIVHANCAANAAV